MSIVWCSTKDGSWGGCDTWDELIVLDKSFLTDEELDVVRHSDDDREVVSVLAAANERLKAEVDAYVASDGNPKVGA